MFLYGDRLTRMRLSERNGAALVVRKHGLLISNIIILLEAWMAASEGKKSKHFAQAKQAASNGKKNLIFCRGSL